MSYTHSLFIKCTFENKNMSTTSSIPILDSIRTAANQTNADEDVQEGQRKCIKINVNDKIYEFIIWKENGIIKSKYEGDFRVIIQKDSLDLIEQLIYVPEVIRYKCRDSNENLIVHVLCSRGFSKYAKYFTDKENSVIGDITGWTALHYACHSDNLQAVESIFRNGDERASKIKDRHDNYPIDLTDNENVRQFLTSSIFDFQTMFRTSYKAAQSIT